MNMKLTPSTRAFLASPFPILGAWVLGGILSIVVPLSKWKKARNQYYQYMGRYVSGFRLFCVIVRSLVHWYWGVHLSELGIPHYHIALRMSSKS